MGFTGLNCEINIDDCAPNPCYGGTCTDLVNAYRCECPQGFYGSNCTDSRCGDGVVIPVEECDDGNTVDQDGCNRNCRREKHALCPPFKPVLSAATGGPCIHGDLLELQVTWHDNALLEADNLCITKAPALQQPFEAVLNLTAAQVVVVMANGHRCASIHNNDASEGVRRRRNGGFVSFILQLLLLPMDWAHTKEKVLHSGNHEFTEDLLVAMQMHPAFLHANDLTVRAYQRPQNEGGKNLTESINSSGDNNDNIASVIVGACAGLGVLIIATAAYAVYHALLKRPIAMAASSTNDTSGPRGFINPIYTGPSAADSSSSDTDSYNLPSSRPLAVGNPLYAGILELSAHSQDDQADIGDLQPPGIYDDMDPDYSLFGHYEMVSPPAADHTSDTYTASCQQHLNTSYLDVAPLPEADQGYMELKAQFCGQD